MELRTIDPRKLRLNPGNPRRTKAPPEADAQLTANIKAIGLIQPPLVKAIGKTLRVIAGERRVTCAIAAGCEQIPVLVCGDNHDADPVRALAENTQRAQMGPVDQWRAIEGLCASGWSEEAVATAFSISSRGLRKLRLLAGIHPAMLDSMAIDLPNERELGIIAAAPLEEQASAWRKAKPKRGSAVAWHEITRLLHKTRIPAQLARFDDATAIAFGIRYEEDLFAPADEDSRTTTQLEAFLAAQEHWLNTSLPENGIVLEAERWGEAKLPPRAERCYGTPQDGDRIGFILDRRTGEVREVPFRLREAPRPGRFNPDEDNDTAGLPRPARPEVTRKGVERIGDLRTDALHQGLRETPFDDATLLGLLVLALGADNVSVHTPQRFGHGRLAAIARRVMPGGRLTSDLTALRQACRDMLAEVLSCREGLSNSGIAARVAGEAIGADQHLASMAEDGFLKCLTKPGLARAATEAGVPVLPTTGKEMRAALIAHVGGGTYILPAARFALTPAEAEALAARSVRDVPIGNEDDLALQGNALPDEARDALEADQDADTVFRSPATSGNPRSIAA